MRIIAKENININGTFYNKGDEVKVDNKEQLLKLNEIGFIEPLTMKEIQSFNKKVEDKETKKEE